LILVAEKIKTDIVPLPAYDKSLLEFARVLLPGFFSVPIKKQGRTKLLYDLSY